MTVDQETVCKITKAKRTRPPEERLERANLTVGCVLRMTFNGLYDHVSKYSCGMTSEFLDKKMRVVDRDVMFDGSEYLPGQKWAIASTSEQPLRADPSELHERNLPCV
jgi:hypothetical protein